MDKAEDEGADEAQDDSDAIEDERRLSLVKQMPQQPQGRAEQAASWNWQLLHMTWQHVGCASFCGSDTGGMPRKENW